jgi:hypothetical protein
VRFTEKFGVSRETLRHVVTLELAENKKQYNKLRRELAKRQAPKREGATKAGKAATRKARKARAKDPSAQLLRPVCCPTLTTYSHLWPDANDRTRRAAGELLEASLGAAADPLRTQSKI